MVVSKGAEGAETKLTHWQRNTHTLAVPSRVEGHTDQCFGQCCLESLQGTYLSSSYRWLIQPNLKSNPNSTCMQQAE
jgi:hypothetical protein